MEVDRSGESSTLVCEWGQSVAQLWQRKRERGRPCDHSLIYIYILTQQHHCPHNKEKKSHQQHNGLVVGFYQQIKNSPRISCGSAEVDGRRKRQADYSQPDPIKWQQHNPRGGDDKDDVSPLRRCERNWSIGVEKNLMLLLLLYMDNVELRLFYSPLLHQLSTTNSSPGTTGMDTATEE